jgi:hypothetical protein
VIDLVRTQAVAAILSMVLVGSALVVALPARPAVSSPLDSRIDAPSTPSAPSPTAMAPSAPRAAEPSGPAAPASVPRAPARGAAGSYQLVTFTQQGLVLGTHWFVVITNVGTIQTNQSAVQVSLVSGTYNWTPGLVEGYVSGAGGSFTVGLTAIWVTVVYHGSLFTTYPITFHSPGLPPTLVWDITLRNGAGATSANSTITFYETNGSYGWFIGALSHLTPNPSSGVFTVSGFHLFENISWRLSSGYYVVLFNETGLPSGINWSVTLNGTNHQAFASPIGFVEPNGSFPYTVGSPSGYPAHPSSGTAVVRGSEPEFFINFGITILPTYSVSFVGEGLEAGSPWTVTFAGITLLAGGPGVGMDFIVPNGTYSFSVGSPPQFTSTPSNGSVRVAGADVATIVLTFTHVPVPGYLITFVETGLTAGTPWIVTWAPDTYYASTNDTIEFSSINGTYHWRVSSDSSDVPTPENGSINISGPLASPFEIHFSAPPPTYAIQFVEVGLPGGSLWTVLVRLQAIYASSNTTIDVNEPNGSYLFVVGNVSGMSSSPTNGSFMVSGSPLSIRISFSVVRTPFVGSATFWLIVTLGTATGIAAVALAWYYRPPRKRLSRRSARRLSGEFRE